eukprot:jgi/Pico_ML_1/52070/g2838.t2
MSAASGVAVDQECVKMFMNLKTRRTYRYIIFKIDEQTGMVKAEKEAGPKATFEEFQENLPEAECRYAVIDYPFTDKEGCQKTKIFFVSWSPEISKVKSKMLYASSKEKFRRELDGVHLELQATDDSEIDTQAFLDKCM